MFGLEKWYAFKVGDLCFSAVGQIVNRTMSPETSGPFYQGPRHVSGLGHFSLIVSPIEVPSLAAAARADWGGLTAKDHERSLRDDVNSRQIDSFAFMRALGAVQRLLYYYPQSGREVAHTLLARPLMESDYDEQADLVVAMDPFQWDGLDEAVLKIYREAVEDHPSTQGGRFAKFDLAFACAKRLVHQGHDKVFEDFFRAQIDQINQVPSRAEDLGKFLAVLRDSGNGVRIGK
jgi:hypothetical protein